MEDECRQREEERVNPELELMKVKESLKKALSGGVTLGLTIKPKAGSSDLQVRTLSCTMLSFTALWCFITPTAVYIQLQTTTCMPPLAV